jgi:hypothetical protein
MQQGYTFIIPNTGIRQYNRIAWIIAGLNLLFFSWLAFFSGYSAAGWWPKIYVVVLAVSLLLQWRLHKIQPGPLRSFIITYVVLLAGWLLLYCNFFIALLHIVLAVLDTIARQNIYLHFTDAAVVQQQWRFKKTMPWVSFQNIVLKDGLLTLDFKNNAIRYFILTVQEDETAFNAYCQQRIEGA